jgi:hypothetical protein
MAFDSAPRRSWPSHGVVASVIASRRRGFGDGSVMRIAISIERALSLPGEAGCPKLVAAQAAGKRPKLQDSF